MILQEERAALQKRLEEMEKKLACFEEMEKKPEEITVRQAAIDKAGEVLG